MALDALVRPLLSVPLFQGMTLRQLESVARRADRIVYPVGATIIEANTPGDAAVLICSGSAVRLSGHPDEAQQPGTAVPEGSLVGEMAMLIETDHTATVVARTPVRALRISRQALHEQMLEDPELAAHFVSKIVRRLDVMANELRAIDGLMAPREEQASSSAAAARASARHEAGAFN